MTHPITSLDTGSLNIGSLNIGTLNTGSESTIAEVCSRTILRYFDSFNAEAFQLTASLFAETGILYPPFERDDYRARSDRRLPGEGSQRNEGFAP